jgi:uncharacterized protein YegL
MSKMVGGVVTKTRKLPVIILADVSTSMNDKLDPHSSLNDNTKPVTTKIDALNRSIRELIAASRKLPTSPGEIHFAVITFGNGEANQVMALTRAADAEWPDIGANGDTPLGAALTVLVDMLESPTLFTNRDFRPIVMLSSDGGPNDNWQAPLERLNKSKRAKQPDRLAAAIGTGADREMLKEFVSPAIASATTSGAIFDAGSEVDMVLLFKAVSWLAGSRSRALNPDDAPKIKRTNPDALAR